MRRRLIALAFVGLIVGVVSCTYDFTVGTGTSSGSPEPSSQDSGATNEGGSIPSPGVDSGRSPVSGECGSDCTCTGQQQCRFTCPQGRCKLTCADQSDCKLTCSTGSQCAIACSGKSDCNLDCSSAGSACTFECTGQADCRGNCGRGTFCARLCPRRCDVNCSNGAICP